MTLRSVTGAMVLATVVALGAPASALELIFGDTVRLRWAASSGDVDHYGVWLGTRSNGFPKKPLYRSKQPEVRIPAVFLGNLLVRVAAYDSRGRRGPFSPVSTSFRFAQAEENEAEMNCHAQQLRAFGSLCHARLHCEARHRARPDAEGRDGCVSKAAFDFAVRYEQTLASSDCSLTEPAVPVLQRLQARLDEITATVASSAAPEVFVSAARMCRRGFRTERRYWRKLDEEKRVVRRERQRALFHDGVEKHAGGSFDGSVVAALVDGLVDLWVAESRPLQPALRVARAAR